MEEKPVLPLPNWVPEGAQHYLTHTEIGRSIRDIARGSGCHASTVLRQIRRVELSRDDPLIDAALASLAAKHFSPGRACTEPVPTLRDSRKDTVLMRSTFCETDQTATGETFEQEAARILRRLCETGAVLAIAKDMEKAVVVRDTESGTTTRSAVVDGNVAEALALKGWINCASPGRIRRYRITATGRSALNRMLAKQENRARIEQENGFADAQTPFTGLGVVSGAMPGRDPESGQKRRARYNASESPLAALARRKDRDGNAFLSDDLVHAGERLREDFELAQMGPRVTQNWDRFLTGGGPGGAGTDGGASLGPAQARDRVARALSDLGPGLGEVTLRCCCFLEGLETTEKRMGWSARSGKIVLRIALQRLHRHYETLPEPDRMIG